MNRIVATYDIESPISLELAAQVVAGEQSTGTFVKLAAETEELRQSSRARVERVEIEQVNAEPSLPSRLLGTQYERGKVTISWPMDNIGTSLPNLLATIAGNLFELAEVSSLRLVSLDVPEEFAASNPGPAVGIRGTRDLLGVYDRPIIGTIIKPSIGLSADQTAVMVGELADAGLDFIKDDELQASGPNNTLLERAEKVLHRLHAHADRTDRKIMYAFNVTDEIDAMARNAEKLEQLGATCLMVSLNWVGVTGLRFLRDRTALPVHGHRNGWGLYSRSPDIGISFPVMQKIWRMAGADHLHVSGLANKFSESDAVVVEAAQAVQKPLPGTDRCALPVFSSGQTVRQIEPTIGLLGNQDFMLCAGGGIHAHPGGATAGVVAFRQAADAAIKGVRIEEHAKFNSELAEALKAFPSQRS